MRTHLATALLATIPLLPGCSSDMLYATGRGAQRAECLKQADSTARERCLQDANMSHDTYKKEADAARR